VLLGEVDYMCRFMFTLAKVVDVEMFALVNYKEFTHATHESAIVRVEAGVSTLRVKVEKTPF
jgi:hypothetical protein